MHPALGLHSRRNRPTSQRLGLDGRKGAGGDSKLPGGVLISGRGRRALPLFALLLLLTDLGGFSIAAEQNEGDPTTQELSLKDFERVGAFLPPDEIRWVGSEGGLSWDAESQGLWIVGSHESLAYGLLKVPEPSVSTQLEGLPKSTWIEPPRNLAPLAFSNGNDRLGDVQPTPHGLSWSTYVYYELDRGAETLGCTTKAGEDVGLFALKRINGARLGDYLGFVPEPWCTRDFGGACLLSGRHREAGAAGSGMGPNLAAVDSSYCPSALEPRAPEATDSAGIRKAGLARGPLEANALLSYPSSQDLPCDPQPGKPDWDCRPRFEASPWPGYSPGDRHSDVVFVNTQDGRAAIAFSGLKGTQKGWQYGTAPGRVCNPENIQGYHAGPFKAILHWYLPADLAPPKKGRAKKSARGKALAKLPSTVDEVPGLFQSGDCESNLTGAAWDAKSERLFLLEGSAGSDGVAAIHVWKLKQASH